MTPFDKLVKDCPIFEFRNKTNMSQQFYLKDGDSIMVQPLSVGKIASSKCINLPDSTIYRLIKPTHDQLMAAGMLSVNDAIVIGGKKDKTTE